MMSWPLLGYNLLLCLGVVFTSPVLLGLLAFSKKARAGFFQKLGLYSNRVLEQWVAQCPADQKIIWFHAVSVGEFNAIRPLVEMLKAQCTIVISTTTRTGQHLAKSTYPDFPIFYFPYDFRPSIHRALSKVQPNLVVITETELWPNFIDVTTRRYGIPLIMVNGRISPGSFRGYQWIQCLMQPILRQIPALYMQSPGDAERIIALGACSENVTVTGNIKFDVSAQVDPIRFNIFKHLLGFGPQDTVLTLASTHSGEDLPLLEAYLSLKRDFPELKLILAPRHPERLGEIRNLLNARALRFSVRSELAETCPNQAELVVLDTIGELLMAYHLSTVAVIGGSFIPHGGQNPLEALSQQVPVVFGPHMFNFTQISQAILEYQAGLQVQSAEEVVEAVTGLLTQPEVSCNMVENGQRLLEANRGVKGVLYETIQEILRDAPKIA